jgi:diguanylate cyclase (GGDEF)-like protein
MNEQTFIYLLSMVSACILSAGLAVYGMWRKDAEEARTFSVLMVDILLWSLFTGFFELSGSLEMAQTWYRLRFLSITTVPVIVLIFAMQFTGRGKMLSPVKIAGLFVIPAITQLFIYFAPDLFVSDVVLQPQNGLMTVASDVNQAWFYVHFSYSLGCILVADILIGLSALNSKTVYRWQAILALVSGIPPLLVSAVLATFFTRSNMQWVPLSLCGMGLICAWALFRYRLLDLVPVAQNVLIQSMDDGLLVFDNKFRLVEMNPAAEKLLSCSAARWIGSSIAAGDRSAHPLVAKIVQFPTGQTNMEIDEQRKHIEVRVIPLMDGRRRQTGRMVVLHDISELFDAMHLQGIQLHEIQKLEYERRKQALVDAETGLLNRPYIDEAGKKELMRAQRAQYDVIFTIVEIDHFQTLRDAFGLDGSDFLLRSLAHHLSQNIRQMDTICRLNNEQFVIMQPELTPAEALARMNDWQKSFRAQKFPFNGVEIQATFSIGLAVAPRDGSTISAVLEAALAALKIAKELGPDQLQVYRP